ncbi:MAG: glycosyltransferase family 9 protein [Deltaproteobacteria bacterium]|nr:glycosyltransferase family 9 protein [Deltaproteobacteria bacterium]
MSVDPIPHHELLNLRRLTKVNLKRKEKVLIIKLGYSETLVNEISRVTSLGDVLRSTVLLNHFKDAHVTWLVDEKAISLLKGNPRIARILPYDLTTVLQLKAERFDTIINLEKVAGICALADSLIGWRRYGFRFDTESDETNAYDGSPQVLDICMNQQDKVSHGRYWEDVLFEMVGGEWRGERPIIGYKPTSKVQFDIGFNHHVGEKWPIKAWPPEYWHELAKLAGDKYTISWQQGLKSLEDYIDWINSCRLLVTNDSLGLHIAHALDKKIVSFFGPTLASEVYVKDGVKLLPDGDYDCLPCLSTVCRKQTPCMYAIRPQAVFNAIEKTLAKDRSASRSKATHDNDGVPLSPPL